MFISDKPVPLNFQNRSYVPASGADIHVYICIIIFLVVVVGLLDFFKKIILLISLQFFCVRRKKWGVK